MPSRAGAPCSKGVVCSREGRFGRGLRKTAEEPRHVHQIYTEMFGETVLPKIGAIADLVAAEGGRTGPA